MSYKSNIWKMYAFSFLTSLFFMGGVMIPFFMEYGGMTFTQIMILQIWFSFWIFALEIPTGTIADYFGRKQSLALGGIVMMIGSVTYSIYPDFYVFMLAEFLFAAALTLVSGANDAIVYDSLKKIRKERLSKKVLANSASFHLLAMTIAAPLGSLMAQYISLQWTMGIMAIPIAFAVAIVMTVKEPKARKKNQETERYLKIMINGVKYLKNHGVLRVLALDSVVISSLAFFMLWTYQIKLGNLGVPIAFFGFIHASIAGSEVVVYQSFGWLEKLFRSKKRYLFWSAVIPGIFFILLAVSWEPVLAAASAIIIGAFGLTRERLFAGYMNKYIESHNRATVISCISMLRRILIAFMYLLVALMMKVSLKFTMITVGIAIIIFALVSKVQEEHLAD